MLETVIKKAILVLFRVGGGCAAYAVGCEAYAVGCAAYAAGCAAYVVGCAAYAAGCAAYVRQCEICFSEWLSFLEKTGF